MTEEQQPTTANVYVTHGASVAGLALIEALVSAGHSVSALAATSAEASAIRARGALPVYGDPANKAVVAHNLRLAEATVIVNLAPQVFNQVPQIRQNFDAAAATLQAETDALFDAAASLDEPPYVVHTSYAYLYDEDVAGEPFFVVARAAEQRVLDMGGCVLRVGFLYDADPNGSLADLHRLLKRGMPTVLGKPGATANWLRAEDLGPALAAAVEKQPAAQMLALTSEAMSAYDFMALFASKIGLKLPPALPDALARPVFGKTALAVISADVAVSNKAAAEALDWAPQYAEINASLESLLLNWRAGAARELVPAE